MTNITIDGYHHARNRNRLDEPASVTHAVISALALVVFVVAGLLWLGGCAAHGDGMTRNENAAIVAIIGEGE